MEHIKIITDKENKMLGFREIEVEAPFIHTPTKVEIIKIFAEKYKSHEESCSVRKIKGSFGKNLFSIVVRIYPSKEHKDAMEIKKKKPKKLAVATTGGKKA